MVNRNNHAQALTAGTATIVFAAYFIAQLIFWAYLQTIDRASLDWSEDILSPIIGCLVMVFLAIILTPEDLKEVGPDGAAWAIGRWQNVLKGLGIGFIIGVSNLLLEAFNRSELSQKGQFIEPFSRVLATPGEQQAIGFVALVLLGPAVEEMMFRGILYGGYRKSFGPLWAALITTGTFVAIHSPYYIHSLSRIVPYIVGSLALLWCRLHWRAIGPAVAAHSSINIVTVAVPSLILTCQHVFYELGEADCKASKFNQAISNLTRAIQLGDSSPNVYIYRGNAKYEEGDLDGAISDYSKAIELNPRDSKGFYDRGLAKHRKADLEGAIADYDRAIAIDPVKFKAYYDRGLARVSEGQLEAAVSDFDAAIQLNPTNSMYYNDRSWAEFLKGDFDSSITDATRSIQLNPNFGYAYGTRGWARYKAGDVSGAIEDCNRATQLFKQGSIAYLHDQGLLDFIAKDYTNAITDWQSAIEQEPDLKKELLPWIEKARESTGVKVANPSNGVHQTVSPQKR